MSKNVFSLNGSAVVTEEEEVNLHLVEKLKGLLEMAEAGELRSLIAAGVMSDRSRVSMFSCNDTFPYDLIGIIEMVKQEVIEFAMSCESIEEEDHYEDDES